MKPLLITKDKGAGA